MVKTCIWQQQKATRLGQLILFASVFIYYKNIMLVARIITLICK